MHTNIYANNISILTYLALVAVDHQEIDDESKGMRMNVEVDDMQYQGISHKICYKNEGEKRGSNITIGDNGERVQRRDKMSRGGERVQ